VKKWFKAGIALTLILMLLIIAISCAGGVSYDSPEKTVNSLLDANQSSDADGMLACLVPEAVTDAFRRELREGVAESAKMAKELSVSFVNRDISVTSQTEDRATVSVNFNMKITHEGKTDTRKGHDTFTLVKRDDKWLLTEFPF